MQGLSKCAANSCQKGPRRRWSVELDSAAFYFTVAQWLLCHKLKIDYDDAEKLWQEFWVQVKAEKSYTVRVNGRLTIKNQRVLNKRVRAKIERMKEKANAGTTKHTRAAGAKD